MLSLYTSLKKKKTHRREENSSATSGRVLLAQVPDVLQVPRNDDDVTPEGDVRTTRNGNSMRIIPIEGVNGPLIASLLSNLNVDSALRGNESANNGRLFILHV